MSVVGFMEKFKTKPENAPAPCRSQTNVEIGRMVRHDHGVATGKAEPA